MRNNDDSIQLTLKDEQDVSRLATTLSFVNLEQVIFFLHGDLGVGKTTFVRSFLRAKGFDGMVKSPTYNLLETYELENNIKINHFDLYRLNATEEWLDLGFDEVIAEKAIHFIEWPDHGKGVIASADIEMHFSYDDQHRKCTINSLTELGKGTLIIWQKRQEDNF